jgi:hypothetical protein
MAYVRHDDAALERFLDVDQRVLHDEQQLVVAHHLLEQHRVHGLLVTHRELLHDVGLAVGLSN